MLKKSHCLLIRLSFFQDDLSCVNNFTQVLPHPAKQLSWLSYDTEFSQPVNIFGNLTAKLYFMDSKNGTSLPVTIKFGIMESPCHNGGTCSGKSGGFDIVFDLYINLKYIYQIAELKLYQLILLAIYYLLLIISSIKFNSHRYLSLS